MPRKLRELKSELRKAGFTSRPGKGDHSIWSHDQSTVARVVLAGHDGDDARDYQEADVRRAIEALGQGR